jgi:starvation-inducible outer membrane lipoprotein
VIKRLTLSTLAIAATLGLAACGDQPQELNANGVKQDNAPYQGVAHQSQYVQSGWKAGDKTSWEQQLKVRAQYGQNDYQRVGAQPK